MAVVVVVAVVVGGVERHISVQLCANIKLNKTVKSALTGERVREFETLYSSFVTDIEADCYTLSGGSWVEGVTPRMLENRSRAASSWTKKGLLVTGNNDTN